MKSAGRQIAVLLIMVVLVASAPGTVRATTTQEKLNQAKEEKAQTFIETLLAAEALGFVEDENIKLPQRPTATITMKVNRRSVIRYFFAIPSLQDKFLMPLKGRILYVEKDVVKQIFAFTGR